ncbi:hypothetical protein BOTBODRAFT_28213 [Botryobasidium botryosum FD-172 SS1]|uniref:Uncharacterized protein n=1 Tax=Botryobasidium botryosum (strain FD-172 SS1) TaxID=930990 RepID=A0A067MY65_BOTB1|nr:hypothetical protein BOTBODRAFT_28213 [Botryobasidium botryosum FD-172 SS1]
MNLSPSSNELTPSSWLPPSLRHIVLQPAVLRESQHYNINVLYNRTMRGHMKALAEEACGVVVQEVGAEDMNKDVQKICARAKREWLDRLDGGKGCWTEEARAAKGTAPPGELGPPSGEAAAARRTNPGN